jgi:hypothetical protein
MIRILVPLPYDAEGRLPPSHARGYIPLHGDFFLTCECGCWFTAEEEDVTGAGDDRSANCPLCGTRQPLKVGGLICPVG